MENKEISLEIITPAKMAYSGKVLSVTLPGADGEFQVLYSHAPLVGRLEIGKIKIVTLDNNSIIFAESGGVVEVLSNKILVLVNTLERAEDVDVARAELAIERAKKRLSEKSTTNVDIERAELALQRAENRIKIFGYIKK